MLAARGFGPIIRGRIRSLLIGGSSCVRVNDINGPYFRAGRGLKQGDPSSPILFILVADAFTKMLSEAASAGLSRGLLPQVVQGVSSACNMLMTPSCSLKVTLKWLEV
jgi:hypothetical protein